VAVRGQPPGQLAAEHAGPTRHQDFHAVRLS
jgi:hypothetical protein